MRSDRSAPQASGLLDHRLQRVLTGPAARARWGRPDTRSAPPPGPRSVVQRYLDLEGRVPAGLQDLPGMDRFNGGHRRLLACSTPHASGWAERKLAPCETCRAMALRYAGAVSFWRLSVILDALEGLTATHASMDT